VPAYDVTVAGELNLDLILSGVPSELEPERELLAGGLALTLGSSSAIFAHNLAALGSRVGFISRIGTDPLGAIALERLAESGADVSRVRRAAGAAGTGLTVILLRSGARNILTYPGTMFELSFDDLDLDYLASARHFHLSSFFLHRALRPRVVELFETLKRRGLTLSLDTNDDPDDRWDGALEKVLGLVDVFLPNAREATKIARRTDLDSALDWFAERVPTLVVKLGPQGAVACRDGRRVRAPALPVDAVDPVGAGDSFNAGFLHQFVRGADLETCLAFGNLAGAYSTTRPGGTEAFRDRRQLAEFLNRHRAGGRSATESSARAKR
jgi:sugar/nucleoside kinase (ribokinase family)